MPESDIADVLDRLEARQQATNFALAALLGGVGATMPTLAAALAKTLRDQIAASEKATVAPGASPIFKAEIIAALRDLLATCAPAGQSSRPDESLP
jgi:hypothetical protein